MVSDLSATDIPVNRVDVLHILAANEDDLDRLPPEQIAAIRSIYFLDSDGTIAQLVREGILTDGMETETKEINKLDRDDLP